MKITKLNTLASLILAIGVVGCATTSEAPKIVSTPFGESTPYCANRLVEVSDGFNKYVSTYNLYSDRLSVAPWMSKDYRVQEADFYEFTKRSFNPILHADLGVPGAMLNNGICGSLFDYAQNELDIDNEYLSSANKLKEKADHQYDHYFEQKALDGHSLTAGTMAYSTFHEKITDLQDVTKTKIRENRVDYINYIGNLPR